MCISLRQALLLAACPGFASIVPATEQPAAGGFVEDSRWQGSLRNFYQNRDYPNAIEQQQRMRREWAQAIRNEFNSGYTPGRVGFGLDLQGYLGLKLDSTPAHAGSGALPPGAYGKHAADNFSRAGGAIRLKLEETVLRHGEMRPDTPIFATADDRVIPETAIGTLLTSERFNNWTLHAGRFTAQGLSTSSSHRNELLSYYQSPAAYGVFKRGQYLDLFGAIYKPTPAWELALYGAEYQETWRQYYARANYGHRLGEQDSVLVKLNLYRTDDVGAAYQGDIENIAWSVLAAWLHGAHTLVFAHQRIDSNVPFDYLGGASIKLANAFTYSDFNGPNEHSSRVSYRYDLAGWGVPGLKFTASYVKGDRIDGSHMPINSGYRWYGYGADGKHWERDLQFDYVLQSGPAKGTSLMLRHVVHRSNGGTSELDNDELRLLLDYPFDIL
ncbi:OprD family outer membrane porin [Pseudomonas sp. TCU-HL1]|uniref:OprD family outer membrane porin n=1 Tax=Pseudomonas sp. TCU-HL1 TaxID=1856685 RepID=UPI00083D9CB1|nr:OprD family outer membrane porin [Pseudomonas sp. TCU-HL1]AOE84731.1 porin [Pseudomonas sp. TCU-HL1]